MKTIVFDYKVHPEELSFLKESGKPRITKDFDEYFVVGRTLNGGRFYSENVDWETAVEYYRDYKNIVHYFGGGDVVVYKEQLNEFGYDEVISEVVW